MLRAAVSVFSATSTSFLTFYVIIRKSVFALTALLEVVAWYRLVLYHRGSWTFPPPQVSDIPPACRKISITHPRSAQCLGLPTNNTCEDWGPADSAREAFMVQRIRKRPQRALWNALTKARHVQDVLVIHCIRLNICLAIGLR